MTILSLAQMGHFIESNAHLENKSEFSKITKSDEERRYNAFKNLLKYYGHCSNLKLLNQELKPDNLSN